ncbi:MAG: hypothetical protein IKX56_05960 [Muribaculaceae bacterium]|nr:hypothetical protein [Muribaculaceae bacterium]
MKKYYYLLMVMLMALVSVGFAACGDDDDEPKNPDIVGTWQTKDSDSMTLLQFTKDGKFNEVDIVSEEGVADLYKFYGTYTVSGDKLTVTYIYSYETETVVSVYQVKGDKLTISTAAVTATFTRVNDSVIEQYL